MSYNKNIVEICRLMSEGVVVSREDFQLAV